MSDYLPDRYNLPACVSGDTFPGFRITSIKINGSAPTTALDSVRIDFRTTPAAPVSSLRLDSTDGVTINNNATWDFTVDPFTVDLPAGEYYYDIETTTGTTIRTYLKGHWTIAQDTTR